MHRTVRPRRKQREDVEMSSEHLPLVTWLLIVSNLPPEVCAPLRYTGRFLSCIVLRAAFELKKGVIRRPGCQHIASSILGGRVSKHSSGAPAVLPAEHHAVLDTFVRKVIHFSHNGTGRCTITEDSLEDFMKSFPTWRIVNVPTSAEHSKDVLERARSRIGEQDYNLAFKNCEHFANWCFEETESSSQVRGNTVAIGAGVVAGMQFEGAVAGATTTKYVLVSTSWGTSEQLVSAKAVSGSTAMMAGLGVGVGVIGLWLGVASWITYAKEKVASRVPIYVFNNSDDKISVTLTCESAISDSMCSVKTTFGVGQMSQTIPAMMDGELAPPVPEESYRFFNLCVQSEADTGFVASSWTPVTEVRVQRGDVLVYRKADLLYSRRGVLEFVPDPRQAVVKRKRQRLINMSWGGGGCISSIVNWLANNVKAISLRGTDFAV